MDVGGPVLVSEGLLQGYSAVERGMLLTGCGFYRTENTASDTELRICLEGRIAATED